MRAHLIGGPSDGHVVEDCIGTPRLIMPDPMTMEQALAATRIPFSTYKRGSLTSIDQDEADYHWQATDSVEIQAWAECTE